MSHVHNIDGYSAASAAEYQSYLERLKAVRQVEREDEIERKDRAKRFERAGRANRDSERKGGTGTPQDGETEEPQEDLSVANDDDPGLIGKG
jgi:hypothetical protein